jgi:hypothetical protein
MSRAYNNVEKLRNIVSVLDYGAVGDGVADDTLSLQAAFNSGRALVTFEPGANYRITNTVTVPPLVSVDFQTAKITYAGSRDRPAVLVGAADVRNNATLRNVNIQSATLDWGNINYVGLRAINFQRTTVHVLLIQQFTIAYEAYSLGQGYAHVTHQLQALTACKYGQVLTCDGTPTLLRPAGFSYANENLFLGGDCTTTSATANLGNHYGVWLRQVNNGYTGHNNNVWYHPCFQCGDGQPGDERIPFLFDNVGTKNTVHAARYESGRGPFAKLIGPTGSGSVWTGGGTSTANIGGNTFDVTLLSGDHVIDGVVEQGSAKANIYTKSAAPWFGEASCVFQDIGKLAKAYNATQTMMSGGLHLTTTTGVPSLSVTDAPVRKRGINLDSGRTLGFFVKTNGNENFIAHASIDAQAPGRLGIGAYDANFTQLIDTSATYPDILNTDFETGSLGYIRYDTSFGGVYRDTSNNPAFLFRLSSAVKFIRVFASGGTVNSIGVRRLTKDLTPLDTFSGLDTNNIVHYATVNPDTGVAGVYARGDIAYNAAATAGQPSYWQCTTAGRLAPAWVGSTAYVVGALVLNDTNKIYECVTAGTSASSGGPTGTGSAITDGTVVWNYLAPKAEFSAGANL